MSERTVVMAGALTGAAVGVVMAYLFFTERGRGFRDRIEPTVDGLKQDFARFQATFEKVGAMANEGMRAFQEFNTARLGRFPGDATSH